MTTLVETRQALELLSMGNPPERRKSKRLAGRSWNDTRRARPGNRAPRRYGLLTEVVAAPDYENDDDFQFVRKSKKVKTDDSEPAKKPGRGRPPKGGASKEIPPEPVAESRKPSAEPLSGEPKPKVFKKGSRAGTRQVVEEEQGAEQAATNGASKARGGRKGKTTARAAASMFDSPDAPVRSAKIALPMSDTPIINRNKEMRKKGTGNRRSSLGSRGRRASSLIDNGHSALPHREVKPENFYKHIAAEGLPEPRRMKQLLTWCGERALSEKPPHGTVNSSVIHGGTFELSLYGRECMTANCLQLVRFRTNYSRTLGPGRTSRTGSVERRAQRHLRC
jgi:kinetochore protein Mis13/DSN1